MMPNSIKLPPQTGTDRRPTDVEAKWVADCRLIAEILSDLEQQLSLASLRLAFRNEHPEEDALACGRISGSLAEMPLDLRLSVAPSGDLLALRLAPAMAGEQPGQASLSVLTADRAEYEALIVGLIGIE